MQMNLMLETRRGGGFLETDREPIDARDGAWGDVGSLRTLLGRDAERFGMGPAVVLGQDLTEVAGPVGHSATADLAAGDRQLGDGHREAARR
jgi:hypothetical protein